MVGYCGQEMQKRNRAYRRWQAERKKNRVKKYWVVSGMNDWFSMNFENDPRIVGMTAHTPKCCSCYMCGNSRKHFGEITIQERRALPIDWEEAA